MQINNDNQELYNYKNIKYKKIPKTNKDDRFNITFNGEIVKNNLDRNLAYALFNQLKNNSQYQKNLLKIIKT